MISLEGLSTEKQGDEQRERKRTSIKTAVFFVLRGSGLDLWEWGQPPQKTRARPTGECYIFQFIH